MYGVTIQELIDKMKMKNVTPEIDVEKIVLTHPDVNRPALQLAGFFDHFEGPCSDHRLCGAGIYPPDGSGAQTGDV